MRKQIRKTALAAVTALTITAAFAGGLFCTSAEPLESEPESIAVEYLDPDEWVAKATEELEAAKTAEEEAYNNLDSMIKKLQEDAKAEMEEAATAVEDANTALSEAFDAMCTDGLETDESEPEKVYHFSSKSSCRTFQLWQRKTRIFGRKRCQSCFYLQILLPNLKCSAGVLLRLSGVGLHAIARGQ